MSTTTFMKNPLGFSQGAIVTIEKTENRAWRNCKKYRTSASLYHRRNSALVHLSVKTNADGSKLTFDQRVRQSLELDLVQCKNTSPGHIIEYFENVQHHSDMNELDIIAVVGALKASSMLFFSHMLSRNELYRNIKRLCLASYELKIKGTNNNHQGLFSDLVSKFEPYSGKNDISPELNQLSKSLNAVIELEDDVMCNCLTEMAKATNLVLRCCYLLAKKHASTANTDQKEAQAL